MKFILPSGASIRTPSHAAARAKTVFHPVSRAESTSPTRVSPYFRLLLGGENLSHFQTMFGGLFLELGRQSVDLSLLGQNLFRIGVGLGPKSLKLNPFAHDLIAQWDRFFEMRFPQRLHLLGLFRAYVKGSSPSTRTISGSTWAVTRSHTCSPSPALGYGSTRGDKQGDYENGNDYFFHLSLLSFIAFVFLFSNPC